MAKIFVFRRRVAVSKENKETTVESKDYIVPIRNGEGAGGGGRVLRIP